MSRAFSTNTQTLCNHVQGVHDTSGHPHEVQVKVSLHDLNIPQTIKLEQFSVHVCGLGCMCPAACIAAGNGEEILNAQENIEVLNSIEIGYLTTFNGLVVIICGCDSTSSPYIQETPPCLRLSTMEIILSDFVDLVRSQKSRLQTIFHGNDFLNKVVDQHIILGTPLAHETHCWALWKFFITKASTRLGLLPQLALCSSSLY